MAGESIRTGDVGVAPGQFWIISRCWANEHRVTLPRLCSTTWERQNQRLPAVTPRGMTTGNFPSAALPWSCPRIRKQVSVVDLSSVGTIFSFTVGFWQVSYYRCLRPGVSKQPALPWTCSCGCHGPWMLCSCSVESQDSCTEYKVIQFWWSNWLFLTESFQPKRVSLIMLWIKPAVANLDLSSPTREICLE